MPVGAAARQLSQGCGPLSGVQRKLSAESGQWSGLASTAPTGFDTLSSSRMANSSSENAGELHGGPSGRDARCVGHSSGPRETD